MSARAKTYRFTQIRVCVRQQGPDGPRARFRRDSMPVFKERYRRPHQAEIGRRVRPVFQDFHLLRMEGDYEYPKHQHAQYEVILVERGPYRCSLNGCELEIAAGGGLVIKPGDWHQDHLRDGQRHYVLHFRLESALEGVAPPRLFRDDIAPEAQTLRAPDPQSHVQLVRALGEEAMLGAPYAGAVQDGLLEVLFWRLVRTLPAEALSAGFRHLPEQEARREALATVFVRFLGKNPNMTELAMALRISPRHLVNECRTLFGESPARLMLRLRLRRADELLRLQGMRVREVSDALGFANPFHFSRVYRRVMGRAPSADCR